MKYILSIVFFSALSFYAGSKIYTSQFVPPTASLRFTALGKFYSEMFQIGSSDIVNPRDCTAITPDRSPGFEKNFIGYCNSISQGKTYSLVIGFTETGAIDTYKLEVPK